MPKSTAADLTRLDYARVGLGESLLSVEIESPASVTLSMTPEYARLLLAKLRAARGVVLVDGDLHAVTVDLPVEVAVDQDMLAGLISKLEEITGDAVAPS